MASIKLSVEPVYTMTLSKPELLFIKALLQNPQIVSSSDIPDLNNIELPGTKIMREALFNAIKSVGV